MNKFILCLFFFSVILISCASNQTSIDYLDKFLQNSTSNNHERFFYYIPDDETVSDYVKMHYYLKAWENNDIIIDEERLSFLFNNYLDENTLHSLLFESFLRYTKNKTIKIMVLEYIMKNNINNSFTNNLKRIYSAVPETKQINDGKIITRYNFNNIMFEENINFFEFEEIKLLNNEIGLLLLKNDWKIRSANEDSFSITCGGGTNSLLMIFRRHSNLSENQIETKFNLGYYNNKYKENWRIDELPIVGILSRSGADKIFLATGYGPEIIKTIESATFNVYLYNKQRKTLYEINYYMNYSPININYSERNRIFNHLLLQTLFVYLPNNSNAELENLSEEEL